MWWLATTWFISCGGSPPPPPAPAPEAPAAPAPAPEAVPSDVPTVTASAVAGQWLLIARRDRGQQPFDPGPLVGTELPLKPVRVYSSELKGLAPCEHLIVAGTFSQREEALYHQRRLEQSGIPVEVERAGEMVPLDGQLEAFCRFTDQPVPTGCPGGLLLATRHEGQDYLLLGVAPDQVRASEAKVADLVPHPKDPHWAEGAIDAKAIGSLKVGDSVRGFGPQPGETSCRVKGFALVKHGQAHARSTTPASCGTEVTMALADCNRETYVAFEADREPPVRFLATGKDPSPTSLAQAMKTVTASEAYRQSREAGRLKAEAGRLLVDEGFGIRQFRSEGTDAGAAELLVVQGELHTKGTEDRCGKPGFRAEVVGVVDPKGTSVVEFREIRGEVLTVIGRADSNPLTMIRSWPGVIGLHDASGQPVCRLPKGFCDSPCEPKLE